MFDFDRLKQAAKIMLFIAVLAAIIIASLVMIF